MRLAAPGRLKFGTEGDDQQQHGQLPDPVDRSDPAIRAKSDRSSERPRRPSAPGACAPSASSWPQQRLEQSSRVSAAGLEVERRRRHSGSDSNSREQREVASSRVPGAASSARSLSSFCCRRVVARETGGALELRDHRIKRAVLVMRRAEIAQPGVRFVLRAAPAAPRSGATCRCPARRTAARPDPRRPSPAAQRRSSSSNSSSRPTSGVACRSAAPRSGSARRFRRSRARRAAVRRNPASVCGPRSARSNRPPICRRVPSAMTIVLGSARPCTRAARFGVSPTTPRS